MGRVRVATSSSSPPHFFPDAFWFTSVASLVAYRAEPKWEAIVVMATDTSMSVRARLDADVKGV